MVISCLNTMPDPDIKNLTEDVMCVCVLYTSIHTLSLIT